RYLGIDPALFRIAFLISLLAGGLGLLVYIIFCVAVPGFESAEIEQRDTQATEASRRDSGLQAGGGLILIGLVVLMREVLYWFDFSLGLPYQATGRLGWSRSIRKRLKRAAGIRDCWVVVV